MPLLAKLQWQCRRGTKELDLVLQHYLQTEYSQASKEEKTLFTELLSLEDDLLASYLLGEALPESPQLVLFISNLKKTSLSITGYELQLPGINLHTH